MKKIVLFCALLIVGGCGSSSNNPPTAQQPPVIQGKWTIHASSTQAVATSIALFDFTNQGGGNFFAPAAMICDLTPTQACIGSLIGNGTVTVSGTVQVGGAFSVSMVQTPTGGSPCTITVTGTLTGSTMSGNYSGCSDAGTFTGVNNPTSTGNYTGTFNSTSNPQPIAFGFSASITEASNFSLTGSATITNSACFTSLTFGSPSIAIGEAVFLQDTANGVFAVALPSEPAPNLFYSVFSGPCSPDNGQGTITKQ